MALHSENGHVNDGFILSEYKSDENGLNTSDSKKVRWDWSWSVYCQISGSTPNIHLMKYNL